MSVLEGEHPGRGLAEELAPEPFLKPAAGALMLHGGLVAAMFLYAVIGGLFHHNLWGSQGGGSAMQVNLVSTAIPLPSNQPLNKNVLTTETPSKAPAPPSPKKTDAIDDKAIPILGKQTKPQEQTAPKTQLHQPPPKPDNVARYGEQNGTSIPRATQPSAAAIGPTAVGDNNFASMFPYYVDGINRNMSNNWYKQEVDPRTPKGARSFIVFTVHRDGTPSDVQIDRSSGSPTLDRSCMRAAQRVEGFGPLPQAYNQNTLKVSYYCEY